MTTCISKPTLSLKISWDDFPGDPDENVDYYAHIY